MAKEILTTDETAEETDTKTTDDLSREEQGGDRHTSPDENIDAETTNQRLSALQELFEKQIARNQNQKQMFDAIYSEMKDYKENFLLETFHKQIIHNLIRLYDNFASVESQLNRINESFESTELKGEMSQFRTSLEDLRFELEEVLYRMDVTPYEEHPKKLDRKLHRTLDTIPTGNPDKDEEVETIHRTGFYWREKVFRPEEVTIFRYTQPVGAKGDETDG